VGTIAWGADAEGAGPFRRLDHGIGVNGGVLGPLEAVAVAANPVYGLEGSIVGMTPYAVAAVVVIGIIKIRSIRPDNAGT
jgi:hypothetical protein